MTDIALEDDERNPDGIFKPGSNNDPFKYAEDVQWREESPEGSNAKLSRKADGTFAEGGNHVITMSNAKEMQARGVPIKKAKKVTRQREALLREVQAVAPPDFEINTWEDAWGFMGGLITSRGVDTHSKLADAVKVFHAIGKATDAFPDKTPLSIREGNKAISGSPDEVYALLMEARRAKENE